MNAHTLRKWSSIKIFMYLLLTICSLLVFWCQGASAMHLTPLDFASSSSSLREHHSTLPLEQKHSISSVKPFTQNYFFSLIRNASLLSHNTQNHHFQKEENNNLKLQKLWQMRMREKRARIQAHRKEKLLLQRLLDHRANPNAQSSNLEKLKLDVLDHNILSHHNNYKLRDPAAAAVTAQNLDNNKNDTNSQHRRENLYEMLNEIRANISVASNRNRRESRFHHSQQQQQQSSQNSNHHHHNHHHHQQQHQMPSTHNINNSNNINNNFMHNINNNNNNNNLNNNNKQGGNRRNGRKRYCSARDPRTLAFEAPTVFEGKIKSMTLDRQQNFSATVEIIQVYKQQANFKLPKQVRLQFAYKNASECDIYREEFRHRGFVRDELEQGRIYFFFVKQIGLGNFTILGQPIKKINRTTKDVEIGVSEKYGKVASIESISPNLTVNEDKRKARIICKVNGEPFPKVTWFFNGRSINRNRTKFEFVHSRRRSDLIIKNLSAADSGKYECRAKNKLTRKPVSKFTTLIVRHSSSTTNRTVPSEEGVKECPADFSEGYCWNGGTCLIIETLNEYSCKCVDGFSGNKCEYKNTNITPIYFQKHPLTHKMITHKIGTKLTIEQSFIDTN
ncbi:unnamed protein product [Chironomus riparius]|uniref:Protein vein n=1 Tax=Chironomus riparius TaxID=315576 RepID=A0A9N9RM96_9DIPT|nr:unnamed protein product [Chironomus riparius]